MFVWKINTFPFFANYILFNCDDWSIAKFPKTIVHISADKVRTKFKNMARGQFLLLILFLLGKLSRCSSDHEDSVSWDVKDSIKFGVADSSLSVSRLHGTCFVLLQWKMKKHFHNYEDRWPVNCESELISSLSFISDEFWLFSFVVVWALCCFIYFQ